ncbi:hypothetical protein NDU88_004682 [Pleurodeles waltl]|uniref:Uncharacterized protein n=1 Tax=Pleurodeles waltl TaxID=8319 RepID=A0AAV7PHE5_PLEWA|nr:hypothetical protein NDU88_004682 [Pleurodeles waltl]
MGVAGATGGQGRACRHGEESRQNQCNEPAVAPPDPKMVGAMWGLVGPRRPLQVIWRGTRGTSPPSVLGLQSS